MKLTELEEGLIYAYRPRTASSHAQPAKVIEPKLWRQDEKWDHWDGEPKRTRKTVVSRARKGDRAGRSDAWHASSWAIGVPVLVIEAEDYMWIPGEVRTHFTELPFVIFSRAWKAMNPHKLLEEGHDGRFTGEIHARTTLDVPLSDGSTRSVSVRLEFIRPQALISKWNPYIANKKEQAEQEAAFKKEQANLRGRNNLMAASIRNRVDALLGEGRHDDLGERTDLHRKPTSTGISTTYEVREETLLKLLMLAEKGSSQ